MTVSSEGLQPFFIFFIVILFIWKSPWINLMLFHWWYFVEFTRTLYFCRKCVALIVLLWYSQGWNAFSTFTGRFSLFKSRVFWDAACYFGVLPIEKDPAWFGEPFSLMVSQQIIHLLPNTASFFFTPVCISLYETITGSTDGEMPYHWYTDQRFALFIMCLVIILPLSIPKEIGIQKYTRYPAPEQHPAIHTSSFYTI